MTREPRKRRRSCTNSGRPEFAIMILNLLVQVNAILYDWLAAMAGLRSDRPTRPPSGDALAR
jgi:hypothetical protein